MFEEEHGIGNPQRIVDAGVGELPLHAAFAVADPVYEREYLAKLDGDYDLGECYLTIDLGELYRQFCYKLIAAIIECDRRS